MFKNESDFKKLIDRLDIDTEPSPNHRENLRREMLSVFSKERRPRPVETPSAGTRQTIIRTILKSRITKLAAAAVIIMGVIVGIHYLAGPIETVALADVFENMKKVPWMHQVSTGVERGIVGKAEQWFGFESNIWISKTYDGAVKYWDLENNKRYEYEPASSTITISHLNKDDFPLDLSSPCFLLESLVTKLTEQGAEIVAKSGKYKTKAVAIQEISLTQNNISSKCRLFIDRKRYILLGAEIKGTDPAGNIVMDGNIEFEYPESGPMDIYALGVPATAKVLYEGTESEVQLAAELKRIKEMFAAGDVDGLLAMLSDAKFEETKIAVANYLAKIGDSRAIEPLEKLSAEWTGDQQDNPFADAAATIQDRIAEGEQPTPDADANRPAEETGEVLDFFVIHEETDAPLQGVELDIKIQREGPDERQIQKCNGQTRRVQNKNRTPENKICLYKDTQRKLRVNAGPVPHDRSRRRRHPE
jgi:hypothetical protein